MIDPTNDVPPRWFAMRVTYRRELMVKQLLEDEKINCFIPMRYDIRKSGRQKKKELVPVIHNLIFVYTSPSRIQTVKKESLVCSICLIPVRVRRSSSRTRK